MGMGGMTADAYVKYASANDEKKTMSALTHKSSMTVAELRNYVNPMTKYYDQLPAKAFIEDGSIPLQTKVNAIYGKNLFTEMTYEQMEKFNNCEKSLAAEVIAELRKAVS